MNLLNYDCITAAGPAVHDLMQGLFHGKDFSNTSSQNQWGNQPVVSGGRVCLVKDQNLSKRHYQQTMVLHFQKMWDRTKSKAEFKKASVLVVFASTKGSVEDFIWEKSTSVREMPDPYSGVAHDIEKIIKSDFAHIESLVVSNACASSHVAFEIADDFLKQKSFDYVLVFTSDL